MSADIAPSGKWVVFDLLGHVYRVPTAGGTAQCVTADGPDSVHFHPRVSPDGAWIAFVSDRNGYANLWVMRADGSEARLLRHEPGVRVVEPTWLPDGAGLIAGRLDNGNYDIWLGLWRYPIDGGAPQRLIAGPVGSPSVPDDGRTLFYQARAESDLKRIEPDAYSVRRLDLTTGQDEEIVGAGSFAPRIAPDGRHLAFARRSPSTEPFEFKGHQYGVRTSLWIKDLMSGEERLVLDPIEPDIAETDGDLVQPSGVLPLMGWRSDSGSLVVAQAGRLRLVERSSGAASVISFEATVERKLAPAARARAEMTEGTLESSFLRWVSRSPDGRSLALQAFGRIWVVDLTKPGSFPRRITNPGFEPLEFAPAWSPSGEWLAFTSWGPEERGALWRVSATGGEPVLLTEAQAALLNPGWSPDGDEIVFAQIDSDIDGGAPPWSQKQIEIVLADSADGSLRTLTTLPRAPRARALPAPKFGPEGRVYVIADRIGQRTPATGIAPISEVRSYSPQIGDERLHATFPYIDRFDIAPDGKSMAVEKGGDVFLAPMARDAIIELALDAPETNGVVRLGANGGLFPNWHSNGQLDFVSGNVWYVYDSAGNKLGEQGIPVAVELPRPEGGLLLQNARILTMDNQGVLENADLLIERRRIVCVGDCRGSNADRTFDMKGKTVMPGLVDTHGSVSSFLDLITPRINPRLAADFAAGVTTMFSPSGWAALEYPMAELLEAGVAIGPRLFSGADKLRWDPGPYFVPKTSVDELAREVAKRRSWGATAIKQYLRERDRGHRRAVAQAAREHGLGATAHLVKGFHEYALTLALDGYSAAQHIPVEVPYYQDVVQFFGRAGFTFNPTVGVAGGVVNESYLLGLREWSMDSKQRQHLPPASVARLEGHPPQPRDRFAMGLHAQGLREIVEAGGTVSIGSHGQYPGLSPHWEIWLLGEAMTPWQALQSATVHGARFLGLEDQIGTIAVGKMADLVVLDANPLDDLQNTLNVVWVIKAGIPYDALSLRRL